MLKTSLSAACNHAASVYKPITGNVYAQVNAKPMDVTLRKRYELSAWAASLPYVHVHKNETVTLHNTPGDFIARYPLHLLPFTLQKVSSAAIYTRRTIFVLRHGPGRDCGNNLADLVSRV